MKTVRFFITFMLLSGCVSYVSAQQRRQLPADPKASPEAKQLFGRLLKLQDKGIMYGHQDDLMYGSTWWYEKDRSDVKEMIGDYPGVVGFELGEIERGNERSLDSVSFAQITEQVKVFHKRNGIITVSWHATNPVTSRYDGRKTANGPGSAWDVPKADDAIKTRDEVKSILPGGVNHQMFNNWLNTLANYFLTWKDDEGRLIPFLFRPYHEHSGDFFWWGATRCTDQEYAELWRYTVDYFRRKGLHNILYIYNTDKVYSQQQFLQGYPGDGYIDMLAIDWYGSGPEFNAAVDKALGFISALAQEKGKLCALSECGNISADLMNILKKYKLSYFLTWRNAYRANPARRRPAREGYDKEFKSMYDDPHTLFLRDIQ